MSAGKVGLVTSCEHRDAAVEDDLLVRAFTARGLTAARAAWDDDSVRWTEYSALIIRSTWNYTYCYDDFFRWLRRIESVRIPVWNAPAILRWNSSKKYLIELADHGVPVPVTEWLYEAAPDFDAVLKDLGWLRAVVKPVISAAGRDTHLIGSGKEESWRSQTKRAAKSPGRKVHAPRGGWMVQEFMPEIVRDGEWSFLFFGGEFSHAVIKRPQDGEFRVQVQHGGKYDPALPANELIQQAKVILNYVRGPLMYGRVDGVIRGGKLILMELELFEPWFFLEYAPGSEERFVDAVKRILSL